MRSKILFVATVLSSIIGIISAGYLVNFLQKGGYEAFYFINSISAALDETVDTVVLLNVLLTLYIIFSAFYCLGSLFNWISVISKKAGFSKTGAILCLIGTISFPVFLLIGIPIVVLNFIGSKKQRNLMKPKV